MHTGPIVDLLLVLLFAKLASELAERINMPGVLGEILAGIIVGPSLLGWVHDGEVLAFLGELGVILLLLGVGMEMDLGELGKVGKAAMSVAVVGVVVPFAAGYGAGLALGFDGTEALFVGAALTATSVGITARVFGDLKALASVEARTVLGAAVADDVLGLVILTVVVRIVEVGSVSAFDVLSLVVVAVGFLALATGIGLKAAPPLFAKLEKLGRSPGTLVALAVAFTLLMAQFASEAKLAPIIGAFVAGICLAKTNAHHRIAADLAPLSHVLVPIFFFRIGLEVDAAQFFDPKVLGIAGVLMVVAVGGKMVSPLVMGKAPGDRLSVGLGMLPRGEVGLIFATIGLQQGVFGDDVYAALLLVVLGTTLIAPPLLRSRMVKVRAEAQEAYVADPRPPEGWLAVADGKVELLARPPAHEAAMVAMDAALLMEDARPSEALLQWVDSLPEELPSSDAVVQARFSALFREAGVRAWRFLYITGMLRRALPELDAAIGRKVDDPFDPDPLGALQWPRVSALHAEGAVPTLVLTLAAVVLDATDGDTGPDAVALAASLAGRLGLGPRSIARIEALVSDADLLVGMSPRMGINPASVRQLAAHLGDRDRLSELVRITSAGHALDIQAQRAVDELIIAVEEALAFDATGDPASVAAKIAAAVDLVEGEAIERVRTSPHPYVARVSVEELAHQARRCDPLPSSGAPRVEVRGGTEDGTWRVDVVAMDRIGLLALCTRVLAETGVDILGADVATWPDGVALASYTVRAHGSPDADRLAAALADAPTRPPGSEPLRDVHLTFDQQANPWHTLCRVEAEDRFGLLASLTGAFASVGVRVESARVETVGGVAADFFELAGPSGDKLTPAEIAAVEAAVSAGVTVRRRPLRRSWELVPGA